MGMRGDEWKRWALAVGAGAIVTAALVVSLGVPSAPQGDEAKNGRVMIMPVGIAQFDGEAADEGLREEAMLRDPAPMFLPSEWSASGEVLRAKARDEPRTSFPDYPPKLQFAESQLALAMPSTVSVPARAGEAFGFEDAPRPFAGFGQSGFQVDPLPPRVAFLQVVSAGDGEHVISQPLANARPPGEVPWQPLEFLVAIDPSGVAGSPVLTESSRVAAVDGYFQDYIVKVLHLGERLHPGVYHVGIGP